MDLFSIQEEAGGGLVFWHPRGSVLRRAIEDDWKDAHLKAGYDLVYTPHIGRSELWDTSGHSSFYGDGMFGSFSAGGPKEDAEDTAQEGAYLLRPMNCPFHVLMYKHAQRSYRDLPLRWAELGTVYRYERSGTLHGLMRVRGFTQDDAHIFCAPDDLTKEIVGVLDLIETILTTYNFDAKDFKVFLSTRPEESVGSDAIWEAATGALREALEEKGWAYEVEEGDGAFYGPKIDVQIRDALGRVWQCSTVQCDFNLPDRFDMGYKDAAGEMQRPIMIHRAIFGSLERFIGVLLEQCAGELPLWLAPEQVRLLPVTDRAIEYCEEVQAEFAGAALGGGSGGGGGLRVKVDRSGERLAKMIRNGWKDKVPLVAVVGDREVEEKTLSVRGRRGVDHGTLRVAELLEAVRCTVRDHGEEVGLPVVEPKKKE